MVLLAIVNTAWCYASTPPRGTRCSGSSPTPSRSAAFALWPSFAPRLAASRAAWRAAALSGPVFFFAMGRMWIERFGDGAIGLLPLVLAAITLGAAYRGRRVWASDDATARTGHLAWFGAIVLGFAAIAVPLQLDKEWITVGWALEGLAVTALWKRLDHPGLKYFGAALFAAVTARLLLNPEVLRYHERGGLPVLNWLAYAYLVPAACLVGVRGILARVDGDSLPLEVAESRGRLGVRCSTRACSRSSRAPRRSPRSSSCSPGSTSPSSTRSRPARRSRSRSSDCPRATSRCRWPGWSTRSRCWALGMARDSSALRWLSLGFLVLSIGKVFLYDLGELRDLYRVASLVGLAISLILVSLAYQRFVFRRRPSATRATA